MTDKPAGDAAQDGPASGERTRTVPRACADVYRMWAAVGLGLVLSLLTEAALGRLDTSASTTVGAEGQLVVESDFASQLIGWCGFAVAYLGLGIRAFAGCDHAELVRRISAKPLPRSWVRRLFLAGGGPVGFPILVAIWAFSTVVTAVVERERNTALDLVFAAVTIATSVLTITFCFALHYARKDIEQGGLDFSGPAPPTFSDYVYLAIGCAATFGTTDTLVTTASMRRTVSIQGVVAWVLNTVVVAVLISLMVQ